MWPPPATGIAYLRIACLNRDIRASKLVAEMSWLLLRGAARCQFSVPSRKRMEDSKDINRWLQLEKMQLISLFGSKAREEIHADEKTEGRVGWRIFLSYARA